jgi:hypothetical protein
MKKILMIIIFVFAIFGLAVSETNAKTKKKPKQVTFQCWCEGYEPPHCVMIKRNANGDEVWVPGVFHPGTPGGSMEEVLDCPVGYNEETKFFISTDPNNPEIGTGYINGLIYYSDNPSLPFDYYEFDDTIIYSSFSEWHAAAIQP